jgi:hypothetical protein
MGKERGWGVCLISLRCVGCSNGLNQFPRRLGLCVPGAGERFSRSPRSRPHIRHNIRGEFRLASFDPQPPPHPPPPQEEPHDEPHPRPVEDDVALGNRSLTQPKLVPGRSARAPIPKTPTRSASSLVPPRAAPSAGVRADPRSASSARPESPRLGGCAGGRRQREGRFVARGLSRPSGVGPQRARAQPLGHRLPDLLPGA